MLEKAIRDQLPGVRKLTLMSLGTALGVHGGPGTLLVSMMPHLSADDVAAGVN
jgi:hypothetical protein